MNERNVKPNKPREENLERNAKSKGKERNVEGKESRSESRDRRKLNEGETLKHEWLRVESESECCKSCSPKGQMLCMQKLQFESLVQRDKQGQKLKL